ncbi:AQG_2a_G0056400.mRNA.1.CDS.1 [Saccharomyces cerevisiae]|uniref:Eukaryotic translation initiation factor 5 n=10 Tax=Saccharomyces TaxID=4930 RepID=IF5_YEAST|nr:translation initiation factor eIF5 [Saccharomyces cerevisiae S288C]P38431.1 RecName: Full=Eukaryotic translation initiation factor 5; Short=eIF-5 [Saccharomyces cerevisiae S288C]6FYX_m Chain m, Eukaryotic translation initiation factor 5 [Saccharomyces cerevisiae S288C]6FYY_m Chain m, Eukaryotic translation initiation factor 5 [Saccharomyces cerevisiae]8CAS_m Chain m, TIF5 isoform 1 [Saccharomyces cerevisiae W303]AHY78209.1 Tif5p [Saccharomyces cerevisiae YJM993]AJP42177.1 Tif5p [Saccharomy|eukprot:NP_015366.1 translation initiation factor eIF5 [Saccharomyces cerevisiae S288C]
MSINICRDNHDPFYRYKMPPIQAKVEGRGNGIKTAVLNVADISHALNRPAPYIVKYFGFELGAQTSISVDKDRYLVNGVHEPAKLQDVLDGFINKFVLCGSCKNPETEIIITKDNDLVRDCKACGKRTPMDLRHKLSSFILKNPPDSVSGSKKKKKAATASANVRGGGLSISDIAQGKSQNAPSDGTGSSTPQHHDEDEDELSRQIKAAASTLEDIEVKDDEWAVDMSEEAIRARAKELEVNSELTQLDEYGEWILEQAGEDKENLPSDVELYKKAAELDVLNDPKIGCVLAQCLFDEDIVNEIAEHNAFFTKILVTPEYEKNFMGGIERFLGLEHKDLIPLLPKILVQLYNNDIISEEEIMRFGTKSSKKFVPKEVSKKVRRAAKPFITWLETAESDDDEEDDE